MQNMYHSNTSKWPLGQAVKTPPFHGGNRGSIPLGVTIWTFSSAGRASALQAEGHRFDPYNFHHLRDLQNKSQTNLKNLSSRSSSSVGQNASLSRQRSRVRVPSRSPLNSRMMRIINDAGVAQLVEQLTCNQQVAGSSPIAGSNDFSLRENRPTQHLQCFVKRNIGRNYGSRVAKLYQPQNAGEVK